MIYYTKSDCDDVDDDGDGMFKSLGTMRIPLHMREKPQTTFVGRCSMKRATRAALFEYLFEN